MWEIKGPSIPEGGPALIGGEDNQKNHELTTDEISIKVVSFVSEGTNFIRDWVAVFIHLSFCR